MKHFECGLMEMKVAGEGADMTFSGYGAVFGNLDAYGDVIAPGAFTETLFESKAANQWPAMLVQHGYTADMDVPVGIWTELREDPVGLYAEGKLADTNMGRELYGLMKMQPRPAINGMSIGYIPIEWTTRSKPEEPRRVLKKLSLMEISLVTFPANSRARVTDVKSEISIRDAEKALRDVGFTQAQSKAILADGFKAMSQRDAEDMDTESLAALIHKNIHIFA